MYGFYMFKFQDFDMTKCYELHYLNLPSSLTRCPVANNWEMTSGGKLLPHDEIDVAVVVAGWIVILSEKLKNYINILSVERH